MSLFPVLPPRLRRTTLIFGLCALALSVSAQPPPPDGGEGHRPPPGAPFDGPGPRRPPPPPSAERLQRELGITEAKARAVADALESHHAEMLRQMARDREQHEALRDRTDARLRSILGDDGFERFKALRDERRRPDGRAGGGPPPGRRPRPDTPPTGD